MEAPSPPSPLTPSQPSLGPTARLADRVLRHSVAVVGLLMAVVLGLGGLRVATDVADEERGARALAQVLQTLQDTAALDRDAALSHLRQSDATGRPRHARVVLRDAGGTLLWASSETAGQGQGTLLGRWALPRSDEPPWSVSIEAAPEAERAEAWQALAITLASLGLLACVLVVAMRWSLRQALQPVETLLQAIDSAGSRSWTALQQVPAMPVFELEAIASALRQLARQLEEAQARRAALSDRLLSLQEAERVHLARELHDELGQGLTSMRVNASWLLSRLDPQDERHAVVQTLAQQCEDLQVDIRGLLRRLRPLEFSGIESATLPLQTLQMLLHTLVDNWVRLEIDRCTIRLDCPEEPSDLAVPEGIALAIYRMTQEALTNIARHAQARHATVALRIESQTDGTGMLLIWSVSDDGRGLHEPLSSGHGLQGMRERAQAQGAELHLRSGGRSVATGSAVAARSTGPSSSSGLTLEAVFPWRPRAHPRFPQSGSGSFP